MLNNLLFIGIFGAMGAISRYLLSQIPPVLGLPSGTILVNLIGSLLLGILVSLSWESSALSPLLKLGLTTGFLGAFTTFSTFSVENAQLINQGDLQLALWNTLFQVVSGLLLSLLGIWLGHQISAI